MTSQLGSGWESNFETFDKIPMASASIGQVHRATLSSSHPTNPNLAVAVKVQFPGIHSSIISDLDNLSLLLKTSALLPRGLYLDNTINVMRGELADECDYVKEAESGRRFKRYLEEREEPFFEVPKVIDELSTAQVLTTEMMCGKPLSVIKDFDQGMRNKVRRQDLFDLDRQLYQVWRLIYPSLSRGPFRTPHRSEQPSSVFAFSSSSNSG